MFSHIAIATMSKLDKNEFAFDKDELIKEIKNSQKFHFGNSEIVNSVINKGYTGKREVFQENIEFLKMPFPVCWFDYTTFDDTDDGGKVIRGFLLFSSEASDIYIEKFSHLRTIPFFNSLKIIPFLGTKKCFFPTLESYAVIVGGKHEDYSDYIRPFTLYKTVKGFADLGLTEDQFFHNMRIDLSILEASLLLLNCKNISKERIYPSQALNKKRLRNGKCELFSYHVLNITNNKRTLSSNDNKNALSHNRVHLCRGHFKYRRTGVFWWQPHLRGQNKKGIVIKDYNLEIKGEMK